MEFGELSMMWNVIRELPPIVQSIAVIIVSLVWMRVRTLSHAKKSRIEIERAVTIRDINNKADRDEEIDLDQRIEEILNVLCGRLYSAMEDFVYNNDDFESRYIYVIRDKNPTPMQADKYLTLHHSKSKKIIFKQVKPFIIRQLINHKVAIDTQETATNESISVEIREMILSGTHKLAGSNEDTKAIENSVITFECILDTYMEISKECVLMRLKRDDNVREAITKEVRV